MPLSCATISTPIMSATMYTEKDPLLPSINSSTYPSSKVQRLHDHRVDSAAADPYPNPDPPRFSFKRYTAYTAIAIFLVATRNIADMNSIRSFGADIQLLLFAKDITYKPQPRCGMGHGLFAATLMLALYATWFGTGRLLAEYIMTTIQINAIYFSSAWFLVSEIDFWRRGFERGIWPDCSYRDSGCPRSTRVCGAKMYSQEVSFWRSFFMG